MPSQEPNITRARQGRAQRPLRWILAVGLIGLFGLVFYLLKDWLGLETLALYHERLATFTAQHFSLTVCLFVLSYAVLVALSLPSALVASLTGGFLFGLYLGTLLNVAAASLGAMALFWAVKAGFGARLAQQITTKGGNVARLQAGLLAHEWSVLFMIRLVPAVPFFVANIVPALVGVRFHRFALSTMLGILPGAAVYTSVGAGLSEVFAAGQSPDLSIIFAPHILVPILGLAGLAALPLVMSSWQKERRAHGIPKD